MNNTALSKNPDEFIRIISGTNQLKTAFSRAGLNKNDEQAWLIYLPSVQENDLLPNISTISFTESAQKIIYLINASILTERPRPIKIRAIRNRINGNINSIK